MIAFDDENGAPSSLVAKDLNVSTTKVTSLAKKLAAEGLVEDTGWAMKFEHKFGTWQWIERPKTESGMLSKPGASTAWRTTDAGRARLELQ